ncbi:SGNH/GDSL hydrolase family protein [Terriglobus saanensis]|uniref:Phospholipase/lecithinase/hemolysin-like protein n=1 Tax=Terriglobus saanensis (strain ATCC BAA-1853 / DSM 23119 / SP1PR4) TaxID=401053 RepID=E8UZH3_TERSS|nr:SGNH/GDSL hydrolase family protein [Terriglobus saanensis]ADV83253.1 phospholipase/lecithinase/hemolysin-like protein [Terriglobus saanensis SP1PR4]
MNSQKKTSSSGLRLRPSSMLNGLMRLLSIAAIAMFSLEPLQASQIDASEDSEGHGKIQFVAFGDSLMDCGVYSPFATLFFGGGKFSTNPTLIFPQVVAEHYGSVLEPAALGGFGIPLIPVNGLCYGQGGSRVKDPIGVNHAPPGTRNADFALATTIPVTEQVQIYLKVHKRFNSNQIVFLQAGPNDIQVDLEAAQAAGTAAAQQAAIAAIEQAAVDLATVVHTLKENGSPRIVLFNMPDLGVTPEGAASADHGATLTQVSQVFNTALEGSLQQQGLLNQVISIDLFTFLENSTKNFKELGFQVSNTGTACDAQAQVARATQLHLNNPSFFTDSLFCSPKTLTAPNAAQTFEFADSVHPTTHLGQLFAQFIIQQIDASPLRY